MNNAKNTYLAQSVATASPERLLVMLFDRLVLDLQRAIGHQEDGDHLAASPELMHAQEIVLELKTSLRVDIWDGAAQLSNIYGWLYQQLVKANVSRDVKVTKDCLKIIEPLAETWREAALASLAG
jgi:flagellar secretion chaperone FliS